jgi:hypothetical protein
MLTKHFKLQSELGPAYTGGKFLMLKNGFAFAQNNSEVSLIAVNTGKVVGKVAQDNDHQLYSFTKLQTARSHF